MRVDVRDSGVWEKTLTIEVPAEELDADFDAVIEEYRRKASIPGFRKGKVPRSVLELQFGHSLEHYVQGTFRQFAAPGGQDARGITVKVLRLTLLRPG